MATPLRRSVTLAAAVATAAALGIGAVALALPASAADAAPPMALSDGTLDWGIKQSFRTYLAQPFAHGRTTLEGGAKQASGNGVFTFVDGTGTYDTGTHATANSFKGGVRFEAHSGALDIRISDVRLTTKGSAAPTGEILADVVTKEKDGTVSTRDDIAFAALDMSGVRPSQGAGGAMVFKDIPAKLTEDGAAAFGGFYKEGDELDAATLTVKAGARPTTAPPTTEPPTTPPPTTEPPTTPPVTPPTTAPTSPTPTTTTPTSPAPTTTAPTSPAPTATVPTTAPTTQPPTAPTDPSGVVDGRLTWGVKQSWQRYVGEMCGGSVTASGGAVKRGSAYDFGFVKADLDADARKAEAAFSGRLSFVCAAHGIDWTVTDLKVEATGTTGTLTADVTGAAGRRDDVALVDLDLSQADWTVDKGLVTLADIPAKLTAAGAATFSAPGGQGGYAAGTAMDPVTVTLAADKDASLPSTSGGSSTTGGSGTTGGSSTTGGAGTVGGAGTAGGAGTVGGSGSVGGSGALAATGSGTPTGLLLAASGLIAGTGAAVVITARRRTTE
ncbi:HtaA domain-containing protein, partial [Streptomyces gardneri]|uniref:HtaA domain-containing protein n=1 Tax=Streptomyces gardneri TaxID=66892 RepID=UPI003678F2A7